MEQVKAPQQVIEAVNNAANILVTVSRNPSVDALSAALGLALVLDKADKHVSAVFSGVVPLQKLLQRNQLLRNNNSIAHKNELPLN